MRIVSVLQPFAQLFVRGVLRYLVRSWDPGYEGPVAIHASSAIPSKASEAAWLADGGIARACAAQGWSGRQDFKRLTFGGIIGSARLVAVYRGIDIRERRTLRRWWAPTMDDQVAAQKRFERGRFFASTPPPLLPWLIPDDAYAWVFANALEFEPITGVKGMQRLGYLRGDIVDEITAREKAARRRLWKPAPVDTQQRTAARLAVRARRRAGRAQLVHEVEECVERRRALKSLVLRPAVEEEFRTKFASYAADRRAAPGDRGEAMVDVEYLPDSITDGRETMQPDELELALRRRIVRSADGRYASALKKMRWEALVRIAERGRALGEDEASVREKLESALDRILTDEVADLERLQRGRRRSEADVTRWPEPRRAVWAAERAAEVKERRMMKWLLG